MSVEEVQDEDLLEHHRQNAVRSKVYSIINRHAIVAPSGWYNGMTIFSFKKSHGLRSFLESRKTLVETIEVKFPNVADWGVTIGAYKKPLVVFTVENGFQLEHTRELATEVSKEGFKCTILKSYVEEGR